MLKIMKAAQLIINITLIILVISCHKTTKREQEIALLKFKEEVFNIKKLNSSEVLTRIKQLTDTSFIDTASYERTPKATIFYNTQTGIAFRIFEKPMGTIRVISILKNGKELHAQEYFENGQVICQFTVNDIGIKDGPFYCYDEVGDLKTFGRHSDGQLITNLKVEAY